MSEEGDQAHQDWRAEELRRLNTSLEAIFGVIKSSTDLKGLPSEALQVLREAGQLVRHVKVERIYHHDCSPAKCPVAQEYAKSSGAELREALKELRDTQGKLEDTERIAHILRTDGPRTAIQIALKNDSRGIEVPYVWYDFGNKAFVHTPAADTLLGIDPGYTEGISLISWIGLISAPFDQRRALVKLIRDGGRLAHYEARTRQTDKKLYLSSSPRFYESRGKKVAIGVGIDLYDPSLGDKEAMAVRSPHADAFVEYIETVASKTHQAFEDIVNLAMGHSAKPEL